jgi:hypothetical protein
MLARMRNVLNIIIGMWEVEIGGPWFKACLGKKKILLHLISKNKLENVCNSSYLEGGIARRIAV